MQEVAEIVAGVVESVREEGNIAYYAGLLFAQRTAGHFSEHKYVVC